MAEIHRLITLHGVDEARRQAVTARERQAVETAFKVLSDDAEQLGFTYSGFALTSLPHRTPKETVWRREGYNLTLLLESGRDRTGNHIGIPYGSYARFILLFLQTEAVKTKSREIELGRSMRVWLGSMGLSIGGVTYQAVKEQAKRISTCRLTFFGSNGRLDVRSNGGFVQTEISTSGLVDGDQPSLWQDRVILDEQFYRALCEGSVSARARTLIGPKWPDV